MKEKQAFKFFVGDSPQKWQRNQEIFSTFLNRIAIDEDDEYEVISVENVQYSDDKDSLKFPEGNPNFEWLFDQYENDLKVNVNAIKQALVSYADKLEDELNDLKNHILHCIWAGTPENLEERLITKDGFNLIYERNHKIKHFVVREIYMCKNPMYKCSKSRFKTFFADAT